MYPVFHDITDSKVGYLGTVTSDWKERVTDVYGRRNKI